MIDERADAIVVELLGDAKMPETIGIERVVKDGFTRGQEREKGDGKFESGIGARFGHVLIVGISPRALEYQACQTLSRPSGLSLRVEDKRQAYFRDCFGCSGHSGG